MEVIFPVLENKLPENQIFLECASELLEKLVSGSNIAVVKDFKKSILDTFDANVITLVCLSNRIFRTSSNAPRRP